MRLVYGSFASTIENIFIGQTPANICLLCCGMRMPHNWHLHQPRWRPAVVVGKWRAAPSRAAVRRAGWGVRVARNKINYPRKSKFVIIKHIFGFVSAPRFQRYLYFHQTRNFVAPSSTDHYFFSDLYIHGLSFPKIGQVVKRICITQR